LESFLGSIAEEAFLEDFALQISFSYRKLLCLTAFRVFDLLKKSLPFLHVILLYLLYGFACFLLNLLLRAGFLEPDQFLLEGHAPLASDGQDRISSDVHPPARFVSRIIAIRPDQLLGFVVSPGTLYLLRTGISCKLIHFAEIIPLLILTGLIFERADFVDVNI
jgi:hypothetical protein